MSLTDDPQNFRVDLSNCDREPIHLLGHIQDFGFLLAVSMDWLIQHASVNVGTYLGREADAIVGEPLMNVLPAETVHTLRGRLQVMSSSDASERLFGFDFLGDGTCYDVAIHISGQSIIIEAERSPEEGIHAGVQVKSMMARVQRTDTLEALFRESVRQLRGVAGFDRVMLYRFAPTGAGEIVAESVRSGFGSFLGLNYPASDIPSQARALYVRNQIRLIADVNGVPVPIVPEFDPERRPIDLSMSMLRSVSPIHIEYLKNMGVGASMSVSIIIDGALWGLFALHHYTPRYLSMELRSTIELFGQMVSFMIEGRLYKERRAAEEEARRLHDHFVARIVAATPSTDSIANFADELRDIIPCDGFIVWSKGEARIFGRTPTRDELPALARFLNRAASSRVYSTDEISAVYPAGADFMDRAAGLLAIPISRSPRDYLMFFRKELVQTVTWAGNPQEKTATFGPNGPRLSPRRSFEAWKDTVYGKSRSWTATELKSAEALRVSILEVLLRFNEETERQQGLATQRQELLIAELNHRVRNILSLIRAVVVQSRPGADSIDSFAQIIGGRIQALARAHDQITQAEFSAQSLQAIIETEVSAYIGQKADRFHIDGPPVLVEAGAFSTMALVFHEMVTNSAKYGALSDSRGTVEVTWRIDEADACVIDWRESGGPPVAPPKRRGFGSTIIERSIPHDLGGEVEVNYRLAGMTARFTLPRSIYRIGDADAAGLPASAKPPSRISAAADKSALAGRIGLIVEDNMIIALDAEQMLLEAGMTKVFTAANLGEARRLVEAEKPDVALLDVNLGRETSFPLIADLSRAGIPFIFATGYGDQITVPEQAEGALTIRKPFAAEDLISALTSVIASRD
ncbi:HWE histidine kinase domain-containing protein [Mangrovicella endophytica]|uniref:HWE histidine kinase domain-containing protein n=1 Tax=Mangrovicella endophytica TaxID=2066697 RepID=UPI001FDEE716|nr:HWE histidine kinase domain-containing protein [Mangrovicella endophytica]